MTKIQKNDFIEIEFTGKSNNEIFDTTKKEEAKKINLKADVKPIIVSIGNQMLLKGFDEALENKEIGKKYSIKLKPEQAFGKRQPSLVKTIPMRVFREKDINPFPGMTFQLDQYIVKILSVSGGRVFADFNNPLAGKEVDYEFTIKRKITDNKEKVNALQDFFIRKRFEFEIKDKKGKVKEGNREVSLPNKKVIFKDENIKPILEMFKQKFKDMTGLEFEVKEKKEEKKKPKEKNNEKTN